LLELKKKKKTMTNSAKKQPRETQGPGSDRDEKAPSMRESDGKNWWGSIGKKGNEGQTKQTQNKKEKSTERGLSVELRGLAVVPKKKDPVRGSPA